MVDIALDFNPLDNGQPQYGDVFVSNNDLALTADANPAGTNPVLQDIIQRLRFFLGEWYLDITQGLPWFQQILVKNPNQGAIDAIFQNAILGTPGVIALTQYSFTPNFAKRVLTVKFKAQTTSGPIDYSGILAPVNGGNF